MPLAQLVKTIRSPLSIGNEVFAASVKTWLDANPGIILQDVDWYRPDSEYSGDQQTIRISYLEATEDSIGSTWTSTLFQTDGAATAEDYFNAAYDVGVAILPYFVVDITDHERNKTGRVNLLVIGVRTDLDPLGEVGTDLGAFIAQPLAPIAAGATGNATLLDATGRVVAASLPVTNVGANAWVAGERNYVVLDRLTGVYIGIASCCGVAPFALATTTTTHYPCVPVFEP